MEPTPGLPHQDRPDGAAPPLLICLLGTFHLLKAGRPVAVRSGGKTEALLGYLALRPRDGVPRDRLVGCLWPESEPTYAAQALHTLVYSLHRLVGDALGGASPVILADGCYGLNRAAGVAVDLAWFDALADAGDHQAHSGATAAMLAYRQAVQLYRGDLCVAPDLPAVMERERLRVRYLTLLAHLADDRYRQADYAGCLDFAMRLLAHEPCREDAHRLVMRCYVQRGERAQALRQFRMCADLLRSEFDAGPEAATLDLFNQVRLEPSRIVSEAQANLIPGSGRAQGGLRGGCYGSGERLNVLGGARHRGRQAVTEQVG